MQNLMQEKLAHKPSENICILLTLRRQLSAMYMSMVRTTTRRPEAKQVE